MTDRIMGTFRAGDLLLFLARVEGDTEALFVRLSEEDADGRMQPSMTGFLLKLKEMHYFTKVIVPALQQGPKGGFLQ